MRNTINVRTGSNLKNGIRSAITIVLLATGFLLLSATTTNDNMNPAYAQSGSAPQQQPS